MSARENERLGLAAPITRRDFVNGTLAGAGAALLGAAAPAAAQGLDERFTGYAGVGDYARSNGNTATVVNAAHALRDERYENGLASAPAVDDLYDAVVVGGGIAGLTAAYEIRAARPSARVLLLENHPLPGGEAKQNEVVVDGVRLIGPQASNDTGVPRTGPFADYWEALGLPQRFDFVEPTGAARGLRFARDNFDPWYWDERVADIGWYCDGDAFGTQAGWHRNIFADGLRGVPLDAAAKAELLAWRFNDRTFAPPDGGAVDPWLDSMSYGAFIERVMGLGPAAVRLATAITGTTSYAASADAVSAFGAKLLRLPGVTPPAPPHAGTDEAFSFPGGNGAIARHIVKALVPEAIVGTRAFADVADAPFVFAAFDRPGAAMRIRLGATALAVRHEGDPARAERVGIVYEQGGRLARVEARAVVVAAGSWIAKHVVRDLPPAYRAAYDTFHQAPALVANVALRTWRPFAELGITGARWFTGFGFWANIRQPMTYGSYRPPLDPDRPTLLTLYTGFPQPGTSLAAQTASARGRMFATPYVEYERQIRAQLQLLFGAHGFDAARDVAAIVLNRWGHAYVSPPPGWYFGPGGAPGPREVPRRPFGRISFGHSELAGRQSWTNAVSEGRRAARQALDALG
ncbi:MAG TPA: FAD-dependent oxidoreductase [Candidatus Limnocylindria bacterium]|jgi:spermidine dehydrogenase|nr:FAD-dependent oxidoreductase [Candidatus Limnocylindria bacterium]